MTDELVQIIAALELAERTILQAQAELAERDDRIKALTAEVQRLDYSTIHTCHDQCPRLPCVQRREIEALTAQLAEAQTALQTAMTELNGLKDALAQVPEFICRKCGRRQDGPTDNEARF